MNDLAGGGSGDSNGTGGEGGANELGGPDIDGEPSRIVEDGVLVRELNSDGGGEVVTIDLGLGFFEWPGDMVKVGTDWLAEAIAGEKAITLHEEVFKGAATGFGEPTSRP